MDERPAGVGSLFAMVRRAVHGRRAAGWFAVAGVGLLVALLLYGPGNDAGASGAPSDPSLTAPAAARATRPPRKPVPTATRTPVRPTATRTPVPPPPTSTPAPPTSTPLPPTVTPSPGPPTATPIPPTATPTPPADVTAPTAAIVYPRDGSVMNGSFSMRVEGSDAESGLARIDLYLCLTTCNKYLSSTTSPWFVSMRLRATQYRFYAIATDRAGNTRQSATIRLSGTGSRAAASDADGEGTASREGDRARAGRDRERPAAADRDRRNDRGGRRDGDHRDDRRASNHPGRSPGR